jgi:DNA adenine methylase
VTDLIQPPVNPALNVPTASPIKCHGGKRYLAGAVVAVMPRHRRYVEPYAGSLQVLCRRDPNDRRLWWGTGGDDAGVAELVNDLNGRLTNFWRVLRSKTLSDELIRMLQVTEFSEATFAEAQMAQDDPDEVRRAWAFFVVNRQSRQALGKDWASVVRGRNRGGMYDHSSAWLSAVEGLPAVRRLSRVAVLNRDALDVIREEDTPETLFYLDPPYVHGTRAARKAYGPYEMSDGQHRQLLGLLLGLKGKVILSGYANELYDGTLTAERGWRSFAFEVANHSSGARVKERKQEILWLNYEPEHVPPELHRRQATPGHAG